MLHPSDRWFVPKMLRLGTRLIRRLTPDDNVKDPLECFNGFQTALADSQDAWENADEAAKVALGHKRTAVDALCAEMRSLALRILAIYGNRHNGAIYREYFPDGYGVVREVAPEVAMRRAAGLITALASETHAELLAHVPKLQEALVEAQEKGAALEVALTAYAEAGALREKAKLEWRRAYVKLYFDVRDVYFDRRNHVEALFRIPTSRRAEEDEEETSEVPGEVEESDVGPMEEPDVGSDFEWDLESDMEPDFESEIDSGAGTDAGSDIESDVGSHGGVDIDHISEPEAEVEDLAA